MKVRAPGKVLLTGAYAVLEGAPALVMAVDRYATVDTAQTTTEPTAEVAVALGDSAPSYDLSGLQSEGKKLGLGGSAALLVASLAAKKAEAGADLDDPDVRSSIFARARDAHAQAQSGGSGVDVAASTYGGVLQYSLLSGMPCVLHARFPEELHFAVYFSGTSARTSELRAQVDALKARDKEGYAAAIGELGSAAEIAVQKFNSGTAREYVAAARVFGEALDMLGDRADSPIVPLEFKRLMVAASAERAAFFPSGAGGGDIGLFLGEAPPSEEFSRRATALGMSLLNLKIDHHGVRKEES
jgi:phosphomevalonate kinase